MSADVISLLQAVKRAEEEKARAVAEAKAAADERIRLAEQEAAGCEQRVHLLVAAEEPAIRAEAEESARRELVRLEPEHAGRLASLRRLAQQRERHAADALRRWFLDELTDGPGTG